MSKTFSELAEEVNALPILDVVESVGWTAYGSGSTKKGQSPLRRSGSKDSFTISENKNIFTDWVLGLTGGPIKFYMQYYELRFQKAVEELAQKFGLGDYEGRASISAEARNALISPPKAEQKKLNHKLLNKVYNLFLDYLTLSDEDKSYLLSRGLTEEEIIKSKFRSCPKRRTIPFLKGFEQIILDNFGTTDILFEVPGFFKIVGQHFSFQYCSGIFIPARDTIGRIIALQVRNRDESSDLRYYWFSSGNCLMTNAKIKYERDGVSCGSPIHCELGPKGAKNLFVTEGYFKAVALRKAYGFSTVAVQGVGNWKGIIPILSENVKRVIVAFDADMCYNPSVAVHAMNFGLAASQKVAQVDVILWDCDLGKGIDDYLQAGNTAIKTINISEFSTIVKKFKAQTQQLANRKKEETEEEEAIRKEKIREVFKSLIVM